MKNSFKISALLFVAAFSLSSCSSDDSGNSDGTTTGNYFPLAVNNKWDYTNGTDATQIKLIGTTTFGANTYYEMTDTDTDSQIDIHVYMNKRGASYYQKASTSTQTQGSLVITIAGFETKMFQDDLLVGETWSGSAKPRVTYTGSSSGSTSATINYTGQITARDVSVTLGSVTYTNVIKSTLTMTEKVNGQTVTISGENWFAKDIGLIYETTVVSTDNITHTRYLTNHELH